MPAIRLVVCGRVQGVGFRYFVSRQALALGLRGEVWNRHDGTVEVLAEHEQSAVLDAFSKALREGPGRVDAIEVEDFDAPTSSTFLIGETR